MIAGDYRIRAGPGVALFAAAAVAAAVLLLALGSGLTFFNDEWDVILNRTDWSLDALLRPHNEHIYVSPVLIYKLMLPIFGFGSTLPFRVVNTLFLLAIVALVFVYVRRRLGAWPALIAAGVLLLLGPSWENLLWPGGISFMGAIAAGLGALLLLDLENDRSDRWACLMLVISLSFSTLGLMFALGVAIDIFLRHRRISRLYVAAVPVALYGIWYLAYGHDAESAASLHNLLGAPRFVIDSFAAVLASLFGLTAEDSVAWGRPLAIAATIGALVLVARDPRVVSRRVWALVAIAVSFWASAGLNEIAGRGPAASRYQLIGAVLVVLIAAELLRGRSFSRGGLAFASVVAAAAVASNLLSLRDGERFLRAQSDAITAELSALELAHGRVEPGFNLGLQVPGVEFAGAITAGPYFAAVDRWGSPISSPLANLDDASEADRLHADSVLTTALGVHLEPTDDELARSSSSACTRVRVPPGQVSVPITLPAGGAELDPRSGPVSVRLRRYAESDYPADLGLVQGRSILLIPTDASNQPWVAELGGPGPTLVCPV